MRPKNNYSWSSAGFNKFFDRSIDSHKAQSLPEIVSQYTQNSSQEINFDSTPTTGSLGSSIQVGGNGIVIDGGNRRISINDEQNNEVVRIGNI